MRSPAVVTTVHGAERVRGSSSPVAEPMHQHRQQHERTDPDAERDAAARPEPAAAHPRRRYAAAGRGALGDGGHCASPERGLAIAVSYRRS